MIVQKVVQKLKKNSWGTLDVDNFAHRWTFLANFFLNTSTPRDLSIAHVFDGEGVGFGFPGDEESAFTINL